MTDARINARIRQIPVVAFLIAQRTHNDRCARLADVLANAVRIQRPQTKQKAYNADHRSRYQHVRIEAEPREIQRHFDAKVLFDLIEGLMSGGKMT